MKKLSVLLMILSLNGCGLMPKPTKIVRHPDAPMLITNIKGRWPRISVWDSEAERLFDAGWVDPATLQGWTLHKYDWEKANAKE